MVNIVVENQHLQMHRDRSQQSVNGGAVVACLLLL
jgi:hypothetical protein